MAFVTGNMVMTSDQDGTWRELDLSCLHKNNYFTPHMALMVFSPQARLHSLVHKATVSEDHLITARF